MEFDYPMSHCLKIVDFLYYQNYSNPINIHAQVARSMEDLTRLPSSCSSVSSSQNVEQARSTRFLNVIETPRSPSDGNLVGANAREALRVTKSSSPDTERAGRPVERTKSESVNKKSVTVKRNKTEKKKKK